MNDKCKCFEYIEFDKENKICKISKGSVGSFSYKEIKKCSIVHEDAKYTGKEEPFTHCVLVGPLQPEILFPKNVYTGVELWLKDGSKKYAYVSDVQTQSSTLAFHEETRKAEEIKTFVKKIIDKYKD